MTTKAKIIAVVAGVLALAATAGGVMVYAQSNTTPSESILDRVARIVGVDSSRLKDVYKQVINEDINAKVQEGKLTQDQASRIRERIENRIESGNFPGWTWEGKYHKGGLKGVMAVHEDIANFLGMTSDELRDACHEKTLVEIAQEKGKSESELREFLKKTLEDKINKAVSDGVITQEQADNMKSRLDERIDKMVTKKAPRGLRKGH
jgi:ribosomal protein S20